MDQLKLQSIQCERSKYVRHLFSLHDLLYGAESEMIKKDDEKRLHVLVRTYILRILVETRVDIHHHHHRHRHHRHRHRRRRRHRHHITKHVFC